MKLEEILVIMQNKVAILTEARKSAVATGDIQKVLQIDEELLNTSISVIKIQDVLNMVND